MQGHPVFALLDADPIVNVNLPDGQYRVTADFHGQSETRLVKVRGNAVEDLYSHWSGNVKSHPVTAAALDTTGTSE